MVYELLAWGTDGSGVRYRNYTRSKKKAEAFAKIPKIQWTDSGHGIVFSAQPFEGRKQPTVNIIQQYVSQSLCQHPYKMTEFNEDTGAAKAKCRRCGKEVDRQAAFLCR